MDREHGLLSSIMNRVVALLILLPFFFTFLSSSVHNNLTGEAGVRRTYLLKSCTYLVQNIRARSTYMEPVQQSGGRTGLKPLPVRTGLNGLVTFQSSPEP